MSGKTYPLIDCNNSTPIFADGVAVERVGTVSYLKFTALRPGTDGRGRDSTMREVQIRVVVPNDKIAGIARQIAVGPASLEYTEAEDDGLRLVN